MSPKPSTRPRSCSIWRVGRRILSDILKYKRTTYGDAIVATESRQLSWSHFVEIIPLKTNLHREFYAEMCRVERWCVRTLREKIGGMLFERTALSRKPEDLARQELAKLREKHEMEPGEETPIGLILCEEKGQEQIELLQLDRSGIRVASYLTDLPPKDVLRKKLKAATDLARRRLTEGR